MTTVINEELRSFIGVDSNPVTYEIERHAVERFACAVGDPNPLYTDEIAARKSTYGGLIAPPTFLRSLLPGAYPKPYPEPFAHILDGGSKYRFRVPVRVGDRITVTRKIVDLFEKRRNTSCIAGSVAIKITGNDITSVRVNDKVKFAPGPVLGWFAHVAAVNLDAGTVHQDVNRAVIPRFVESDLAKLSASSRECCVVRNLQRQSVDINQRLQAALRLSPRQMKHHTKNKRRLDRQIGVLELSTRFPAWWGSPLTDGFVREPERQGAAVDQGLVIGVPVCDLMSLLDVLGLASLKTAHRASGSEDYPSV